VEISKGEYRSGRGDPDLRSELQVKDMLRYCNQESVCWRARIRMRRQRRDVTDGSERWSWDHLYTGV
jgi:hypothetical protein